MEIIEHGNQYTGDIKRTIMCKKCKCKFIAAKSETILGQLESTHTPCYYIRCPECNQLNLFGLMFETLYIDSIDD